MNPKSLVKYFIIWELIICVIVLVSPSLFSLRYTYLGGHELISKENPNPYKKNPLLYFRSNFDGFHYISIARQGYGYAEQAFFPLYPNLIKSLNNLIKNFTTTGVIISSSAFLVSLYFLAKLIALDQKQGVAKWTILALLAFPVSFFFTSVYTEGLFFLFIITSFYAARKKYWLLAGILGGLAAYTRLVGIFLFPCLLIELWLQTRSVKKMIPLLFIPLGLGIFMTYLHQTTGDALAFIHVQKLFGQGRDEKIILPYQVFWRYLKMLVTVNRADPLYITIVGEAITGAIFFTLAIWSLFKQRLSYSLFNLGCLVLPTLSGSFTSLSRYVLICFPSFLLLGKWLSGRSNVQKTLYFVVSIALMILYLSLFARGYWVA